MKCPFCDERERLMRALDKASDGDPYKREALRLGDFDSEKMVLKGNGYVHHLHECPKCGSVLSSTDWWTDDGRPVHFHECQACGLRFPAEGFYEGHYVNDSLKHEREPLGVVIHES